MSLFADSTNIAKTRLELVLNISNTLSRFTGNGAAHNIFDDPFLIALKITDKPKKKAFRIGFNFSVSNTEENLNGTSRRSVINSWAPLLGYEWRKNLGNRFQFYGGIDARYYDDKNKTTSTTFSQSGGQSTTEFLTRESGFGGGPFCGFLFSITPRISISTEGNLYVNYLHKVRKFTDVNSSPQIFEDKFTSNLSPAAPSALFLIIRF